MVKVGRPMAGNVVPQTPGQKPGRVGPQPMAGNVVPLNPRVKPQGPSTPIAGKVVPNQKPKFPFVPAAIALGALGIGFALYQKFKK